MEFKEFLENFREQFEDTDPSEIQAETDFHDLDEWGSLLGMSVIAMTKEVYGKKITGKQIKECKSVKALFDLIESL